MQGFQQSVNAITRLIEQADIHGWIKHNGDYDIPEKFSVPVLKALVCAYLTEWPSDNYEGLSYKDILLQILENNSELDEPICFSDE
jgi:hypothetical protein